MNKKDIWIKIHWVLRAAFPKTCEPLSFSRLISAWVIHVSKKAIMNKKDIWIKNTLSSPSCFSENMWTTFISKLISNRKEIISANLWLVCFDVITLKTVVNKPNHEWFLSRRYSDQVANFQTCYLILSSVSYFYLQLTEWIHQNMVSEIGKSVC